MNTDIIFPFILIGQSPQASADCRHHETPPNAENTHWRKNWGDSQVLPHHQTDRWIQFTLYARPVSSINTSEPGFQWARKLKKCKCGECEWCDVLSKWLMAHPLCPVAFWNSYPFIWAWLIVLAVVLSPALSHRWNATLSLNALYSTLKWLTPSSPFTEMHWMCWTSPGQ